MMPKLPTNIGGHNCAASRLIAQKKKVIAGICLVGIMVFMWSKVLLNDETAADAKASSASESTLSNTEADCEKLWFVELPNVEGRNDVLNRSFFDSEGWAKFNKEGEDSSNRGEGVTVVKQGEGAEADKKDILRTAEQLRLEAIASGQRPQAFISGKLVSLHGRVAIKSGGRLYEFEVIEIRRNSIVLSCAGVRLVKKMVQPDVAAD